jgi:hypothetical protein
MADNVAAGGLRALAGRVTKKVPGLPMDFPHGRRARFQKWMLEQTRSETHRLFHRAMPVRHD